MKNPVIIRKSWHLLFPSMILFFTLRSINLPPPPSEQKKRTHSTLLDTCLSLTLSFSDTNPTPVRPIPAYLIKRHRMHDAEKLREVAIRCLRFFLSSSLFLSCLCLPLSHLVLSLSLPLYLSLSWLVTVLSSLIASCSCQVVVVVVALSLLAFLSQFLFFCFVLSLCLCLHSLVFDVSCLVVDVSLTLLCFQ